MPMLDPTTELEAVNEMLLSIGQAPVSTLAVTGIQDVNLAKSMLTSETRRVAIKKFNWNTDEEYELSPNTDGIILIPTGALEVDPEDKTLNAVIRRNLDADALALWNKDDHTWVFEEPVECKITWGFSFEDMPEAARSYIHIKAGRRFQQKVVGSEILDSFEQEDEARAWVELHKTELRTRDTNMFTANASMAAMMNRRY